MFPEYHVPEYQVFLFIERDIQSLVAPTPYQIISDEIQGIRMAIYRCNKCAYLAEMPADSIGKTLNCPQCSHPDRVYDTTFYVKKLLEKYFASLASLKRIQAEADSQESPATPAQQSSLDGINLHNTDLISTDLQHGPIHDWFSGRKIQIKPNYKAVDTTGFFDEVAVELGKNYETYKEIINRIRSAQRVGQPGFFIQLAKKSQKEAQAITTFCRLLYDYSFVAKYYYQKPEKTINLTLQSSQLIQDFFAGEWLEWYTLMQVLELCQTKKKRVSCARNLSIVFDNEDIHELDVFFLVNGNTSLCIECKTGEYRRSIDKYSILRKRLGLTKEQFIVCVLGLPDDQASGLSSMYDLTFVSEKGLMPHVARLL